MISAVIILNYLLHRETSSPVFVIPHHPTERDGSTLKYPLSQRDAMPDPRVNPVHLNPTDSLFCHRSWCTLVHLGGLETYLIHVTVIQIFLRLRSMKNIHLPVKRWIKVCSASASSLSQKCNISRAKFMNIYIYIQRRKHRKNSHQVIKNTIGLHGFWYETGIKLRLSSKPWIPSLKLLNLQP